MNEGGCRRFSRLDQPDIKFPDIPPVELCRRYSCLDNFVLSACIVKASDNLQRLGTILDQTHKAHAVKHSYRRSGEPTVAHEDRKRHATGVGSLVVDGGPRSGCLAEDVHRLLENLGTLIGRLEADIHVTWGRILQLGVAMRHARQQMESTSSGFKVRLQATVSQLRGGWEQERATIRREMMEANAQGEEMSDALDAIRRRIGDIGDEVKQMKADGVAVGHETLDVFEEVRRLKELLREKKIETNVVHHRLSSAHEIFDKEQSKAELVMLQRLIHRRSITEKLETLKRDVSAAASLHSQHEQQLEEVVQEAEDAEAQVTASLESISNQLTKMGIKSSSSSASVSEKCSDADLVYLNLRDAVTQMEGRLVETRTKAVQMEVACRDQAQQIAKLELARHCMNRDKKEVEIIVDGVRIEREGSAHQMQRNINLLFKTCERLRKEVRENIAKKVEATKSVEAIRPGMQKLKQEVKEVKLKLCTVKKEALPLTTKLEVLRTKYNAEKEAQLKQVQKVKKELDYAYDLRRNRNTDISDLQRRFVCVLNQHELLLKERDFMEDNFHHHQEAALPALQQLRNAVRQAMVKLSETCLLRASAENFVDQRGTNVMVRIAAAKYNMEQEELRLCTVERQLELIVAALGNNRERRNAAWDILGRHPVEVKELEEETEIMESEKTYLSYTCAEREEELSNLKAQMSEWDHIKWNYRAKHNDYMRQMRMRLIFLKTWYDDAVKENAELRRKYNDCVERWLAAREVHIPRMMPQLMFITHLINTLQVVRLVRSGVSGADRTLALRRLYFEGELERGQQQLGELYHRVTTLRTDLGNAVRRILKEFIGLMKGDVAFPLCPEQDADGQDKAVQMSDDVAESELKRQNLAQLRLQEQRRLVMALVMEGETSAGRAVRLPALPARRNAERAVSGLGQVHRPGSGTTLPRI